MSLSLAPTADFLPSMPAGAGAIRRRSPLATPAATDRKLVGIMCIIASTVCFPLSDLSAQSLMGVLPPVEVAWLRYCVFFVLALPLLARGSGALRTARPGIQVLRGIMTAAGTLAALVSFKFLPVADTTAIGFVCPVFVTGLSVLVLKEVVGLRRWAAALVALVGVMIIVQPGAATFRPIALLPLLGAAAGAVAVICTRLTRADDPRTTILYTTGVGTAVLTAVAMFDLVMPSAAQLHVVLVVGVFGAAGSILQVVGYRLAPASMLAPFTYLQLIVASGLSFVLLGAMPQASMVSGAAIIAGSAIYTGYRERVRGAA